MLSIILAGIVLRMFPPNKWMANVNKPWITRHCPRVVHSQRPATGSPGRSLEQVDPQFTRAGCRKSLASPAVIWSGSQESLSLAPKAGSAYRAVVDRV